MSHAVPVRDIHPGRTSVGTVAAAVLSLLPAPALEAQLPAEDRPLRAEVEERYGVGGVDVPEWAAFQRVSDVAFGNDGRLFILDDRGRRGVIVDADGGFLGEFGGKGDGPGEFNAPRELAALRDGSVAVLDVLRRRLARFGPGGELVTEASAAVGAGAPATIVRGPGASSVVGDVRVLTIQGEHSTRTPSGLAPIDHRPVQRYPLTRDGEAVILHRLPLRERPTDGRGRRYLTAFFPELHIAPITGGRTAMVDGAAYAVTILRPEGGVETVIRRALEPRTVTEADRERERERLLARLEEGVPPEATVSFGGNRPSEEEMEERHRRRIEEMRFPERFPAIAGLAADHAGRLWIERTGEDPHGPGPIDVVTREGGYVGTLPPGEPALPDAFGPDGLAAYVESGELDVPVVRVVRLRLRGSGGG